MFGDRDVPGSFTFVALLVAALCVGLAVLALAPIETSVAPGRVVQKTFGFRTREIAAEEVREVLSHGYDVYLVLVTGEWLLLLRDSGSPHVVAERVMARLIQEEAADAAACDARPPV
ncbi:MAG: hypothetical protein AB1758_07095 [Candidatus Eremiobacterota bacterium]